MFANILRVLILVLPAASAMRADVILENTIPTGNLWFQPPLLTGAAPVFGVGGGVVAAEGFTAPVSAALHRISVAVEYVDLPQFGVTGRAPMRLTLLADNGDSPGAPIESWVVPVSPSDTVLTVVTVNSLSHAMLLAGQQYWVSEVPTDPVHTGIGWGLAAPGTAQLPMTESLTGMNNGWLPTNLNLPNEFSVSGTRIPEPATFGLNALVPSFHDRRPKMRARFACSNTALPVLLCSAHPMSQVEHQKCRVKHFLG